MLTELGVGVALPFSEAGAEIFCREVRAFWKSGVGGESAAKATNVLQEVLKTAKPTPGKSNQLEAILGDGTKVIFRRDIGDHAHPIGAVYPPICSLDYNIEIHASNPAKPGKFTPQENVHIIVDEKLQPIDIFLKDKTRIINPEINKNKLNM